MGTICDNIINVKQGLPNHVKLVAVSKTKPNEDIMQAYSSGQRVFGENKVQELVAKFEELPKDIEWHFIGHLQTNKVKYIAPFVSLIHAVDGLKLLKTINREALKNKRVISCLLQFHVAEEDTKFGLNIDEAFDILSSEEFRELNNIQICGVMGMATHTDDELKITREFLKLTKIFHKLKDEYFVNTDVFCELSMGMSNDYLLAVEQGSTMVRVGSTIFGERNYH